MVDNYGYTFSFNNNDGRRVRRKYFRQVGFREFL